LDAISLLIFQKEGTMLFNNIYKGKKVLITGHCGFKGSWASLWLRNLGAEVIGYGHPPNTEPNHYTLLGNVGFCRQELLDFRDISDVMRMQKPDLVIHLAAKAIVARTFDEPRETFENNVMGAVNILEVCRQCKSVKGIVMITTDKIYENREWNYAYREVDKLGGVDPYSASKVCVEQVIRCYREAFGMNIATARAGNVIGGGDWSYKRLIPDIVKAASKGEKTIIHTPNATRPFQHVLEALSGYLLLGQHILEGKNVNRAWNFGPEGEMSVLEVLQVAHDIWPAVQWEVDETPTHPFMQYLLKIDSTESKKLLGWNPVWDMKRAVENSIIWYMVYYENGEIGTDACVEAYEEEYHAM
jgi:CDP-glucose 4,6-dehydratase